MPRRRRMAVTTKSSIRAMLARWCLGTADAHPTILRVENGDIEYTPEGRMFNWDTSQPFFPLLEGYVYPPVQGGTLAELLERLIARTPDVSKDRTYRRIFFTAYPFFTNCEQLFQGLVSRFHVLDIHDETGWRAERRQNIVLAMKEWVECPYVPIDSAVQGQIREFALTVRHLESVALPASGIVYTLHTGAPVSAAPLVPAAPCDSAAITPKDLAIALTIILGRGFNRLRPSDYIIHLCDLAVPDQVKVVRETNQRFICWVKQAILQHDRLTHRVRALQYFIEVAEECRKLRNFLSMAATITAWESLPIWRLTLTRDGVNSKTKAVRDKLNLLLELEHYRAALHSPNDYHSCIPWLELHLREFSELLDSNPAHIDTADGALINFTRCIEFVNSMRELAPFKAPDLVVHRDESKIAYVEYQLQHVDIDRAEDTLEERSRIHAADEREIVRTGVPGLEAAGFKFETKTKI